ncbi:NAD(P)/FAD-dependent oxidoreductase [Terrarubrum flagellatum]|uniref:FAD-dependent oxidoreductase n=1 Tax=Terrirubrum flagellatum TaxID=2895980 RepID=UPI003144ED21
MRPLAIAIAGRGPAGMAAALFLHRAGHLVTVFDQMPAPQPIGSGLMMQPTGLATLGALGLESEIRSLGRPITRMFGKVLPSGRTVLDVAYDPADRGLRGVAVHRAALFGVLHRALLSSGVAIETSTRIVECGAASAGRPFLVDDKGRRHGPFDLVVDALGSRSPLAADDRKAARGRDLSFGALWATLPWISGAFDDHQLEQRYRRADVMVGVLPIGRMESGGVEQTAFFWSLRPEQHAQWLANGLDAWKDEVRALWPQTEPLLSSITHPEQLTLAAYRHFTLPYPAHSAIARIGDAAHATSPQLGQGANMALLDAWALAAALASENDLERALHLYVRLRGLHVRVYQAVSAIFTPFYQSDSDLLPWLRDHVLWPISRVTPMPTMLSWLAQGRLIDPVKTLAALTKS